MKLFSENPKIIFIPESGYGDVMILENTTESAVKNIMNSNSDCIKKLTDKNNCVAIFLEYPGREWKFNKIFLCDSYEL